MSTIDELSTPSLHEKLAAEMTNLTGSYLSRERKQQVARETNRVAFELFCRNELGQSAFDEVTAICKPFLPAVSH